jgi:hypothetical protein
MRRILFSLVKSDGVSKNPSFHTDLKKRTFDLVKSVPKNRFLGLGKFPIDKLVFWLILFLCALFGAAT